MISTLEDRVSAKAHCTIDPSSLLFSLFSVYILCVPFRYDDNLSSEKTTPFLLIAIGEGLCELPSDTTPHVIVNESPSLPSSGVVMETDT